MRNIKDFDLIELTEMFREMKLPAFRAKQVFEWIYNKNITNWEQMTNLPKDLRQQLIEKFSLTCLKILQNIESPDGTVKYLFELEDGETVESVYLPDHDRYTVCFSTQVGCPMNCFFCATGKNGFKRNLTVSEIIDQIMVISSLSGHKLTNLVAMGQGEPMLNYANLMKALHILNDATGLQLGARRITISTCGVIPGIESLISEKMQVNLAISLHAANDELRNRLMPVNRQYSLSKLLDACRQYATATNRRITFEYTMIKNVNDSDKDLQELITLLRGMLCHVNLIPFNPVPGLDMERSDITKVKHFLTELTRNGIEATVRKERGSKVAAACGQLQGRFIKGS